MHRRRGAIAVVLGAIVMALAGIASFFTVVDLPLWLTDSNWTLLHFYHGRVRVFWIRAFDDPIDVVSYHDPVHLRIAVRPEGQPPLPGRGPADAPPVRPTDIRINLGTWWRVDGFGFNYGPIFPLPGAANARVRIAYFRLPVWLVVAVLLIIPVRAALFGPIRERHRQRRNRCTNCGYNLKGLIEPRCPECGRAI